MATERERMEAHMRDSVRYGRRRTTTRCDIDGVPHVVQEFFYRMLDRMFIAYLFDGTYAIVTREVVEDAVFPYRDMALHFDATGYYTTPKDYANILHWLEANRAWLLQHRRYIDV